jgi:uncharacterized protein (DUF3084 family)
MTTTDVLEIGSAPPVPDDRGAGTARRRRWILVLVGLACVGASVVLVAGNEVQTNSQFAKIHQSLDTTRQQIGEASQNLASVRHDLDATNGQVTVASSTLAGDTSKLAEARTTLASAQSNISRQSSTIGDLHTCLGGVERALNALALNDQNQAVGALNSVATSCSSAVALDG